MENNNLKVCNTETFVCSQEESINLKQQYEQVLAQRESNNMENNLIDCPT